MSIMIKKRDGHYEPLSVEKTKKMVAFACLGLDRLFKKWCGPLFIWLGIIGLAGLDEFHQYLTGDRTPSLHDVALDSAGALLAILFCIFIYWIRHHQEKSNS